MAYMRALTLKAFMVANFVYNRYGRCYLTLFGTTNCY